MDKLLLIAFDESEISQCAGFAQTLSFNFDILLLLSNKKSLPDIGAGKIIKANLDSIPPADGLASALLSQVNEYNYIASASNMRSKDVLPRLSALLGSSMITDVIDIESPTVFKRPMFAGSIIASIEILKFPTILSIRPTGFKKFELFSNSPHIEEIQLKIESQTKRISEISRSGLQTDLTQAKVVVSGGRPLKDSNTFEKLIIGLAHALGGAAGATRSAVDSGIAPNELQIGQTGKVVAPDFYIAAGISGATQHIAGIKDSKYIIAINSDSEAPIFEIADIGIVADLYEVLPKLIDQTKQASA